MPCSHEDIVFVYDSAQRFFYLVNLVKTVTENIGYHQLEMECRKGTISLQGLPMPFCPLPLNPTLSSSADSYPVWRDTCVFGESHTQIKDFAFPGNHKPVLRNKKHPQKIRKVCGGLIQESLRYDRLREVCPYVPRNNGPTFPYLLWSELWIHGHKEDLHDPLVADRQWDTEVAEGIKGHGHIATIRTHQCGLEEAMESVHNY